MKIADVVNHTVQKSHKFSVVMKYFGVEVEPWNHPDDIAKYILNMISHTHMFGCQIIAPMGYGKTTAATVIAHHIHMKDPSFVVVWAEATDFQHLKRFLLSLKKQPTIIIFDDISSVLKQMADRDIEKNFEDLTKIRWIIDPANGSIPMITFVNYHYSKNLEKEFRAVLGMTVFLGFGSEEYTNIDTIMPKRSLGRNVVEQFSRMADKMFTTHKFSLMHSTGRVVEYETDKPGRIMCAVMGKEARLIVFAKEDQCALCSQTKFRKHADSMDVYQQVYSIYKSYGRKAWMIAAQKRGYYTFNPQINTALNFIENDILTKFSINWPELAEIIKKDNATKRERMYHKRKEENQALEVIEAGSKKIDLGDITAEDEEPEAITT